MKESNFNQVILDSHIHYYNSWNISLDQLLSTIHDNLTANGSQQPNNNILLAACLLDTAKSETPIADLLNQINLNKSSSWDVTPLEEEPYAFWARKDGKVLLIITGTQLNTSEGLEVLKIGQIQSLKNGDSISQMLEEGGQSSLTILPWAVGKWLGKRGSIILDCLGNNKKYRFILGDNGGRPWFWGKITPFYIARKKQLTILSGSDPLPVSNGYLKSGTFGNVISCSVNDSTPWASIVQSLDPQHITHFGKLSSTLEFLSNQIKLRL